MVKIMCYMVIWLIMGYMVRIWLIMCYMVRIMGYMVRIMLYG